MVKKILISIGLVGVLVVGATVWLRAAPSVGAVSATPAYVVVNSVTPVLFTVRIDDPTVIATGVNLLKTDSTGKTLSTVGVMRDNGTSGDAVSGDKVFSLRTNVNESSVGSAYYRVSAAFRGQLRRVLSAPVAVSVWQRFVDAATGVSLGYPQNWELDSQSPLKPSAISDVSFFSSDEAVQVTVYGNPMGLHPRDWFDSVLRGNEYTGGLGSGDDFVDSVEVLTINGRTALHVVGTLFSQRAERVFIQMNDHIVGIEYVQPFDWPFTDVLWDVVATLSN